jgi:hypothetical protein
LAAILPPKQSHTKKMINPRRAAPNKRATPNHRLSLGLEATKSQPHGPALAVWRLRHNTAPAVSILEFKVQMRFSAAEQ